ncbi:MAG TPA: hypothetical protein VIC30_07030 [Orrella sp.]
MAIPEARFMVVGAVPAADALASRWSDAGLRVHVIVPPSGDVNDLLREAA